MCPENHAPTPQEATAWRLTAGATPPSPEAYAAPPTQREWEPTSPRHRELVEEDPLGLHEIRKKMGVAIRLLVHRKKAVAEFPVGSKGCGGKGSNEILGRVREGMNRFRRSMEESISRTQPDNGGLDWSLQRGRNLVCQAIPPNEYSSEVATVPQVCESPVDWAESSIAGKNEGAQRKGMICKDMVSVSIQRRDKEQSVNLTDHGMRKRKEEDQESEERISRGCVGDYGGTILLIIQERITLSQTGDPPDIYARSAPNMRDPMPCKSHDHEYISIGRGKGATILQSQEHTTIPITHDMENTTDNKMKQPAAENKLEVVASNGGERGGKRLERGSSSQGGRGGGALPTPQPGGIAALVERRGAATIELDLTRARAAMSTRWLAVGYFSVLPFSTAGLFGELKSKWGLRGRLDYTPLRNNRFMLEFEREGDRRHVLENGPWTHRKDAFLIVPFDGQGKAADVLVNVMPIWARIYDVPPLMLSEEIGWMLGGLLGKVLRVDTDKFGNIFSEFLRVRVEHDVNTPLLREISPRELGVDKKMDLEVKYERAPRFCMYCGHIGHGERDCRLPTDDQAVRLTGAMRASPYKSSKNKGGFVAPDACSARRFLHFGSELDGVAWTAPAKLAWEKLGRDKKAVHARSQDMVRCRDIPDDVLLDPAVQAAIAAVSALRVSDEPGQKGTRKTCIGENTMTATTKPVLPTASTPTIALGGAGTSPSTPPGTGAGADIDKTPLAHNIKDAVTPPYPPGFGPDAVKATPDATASSPAAMEVVTGKV